MEFFSIAIRETKSGWIVIAEISKFAEFLYFCVIFSNSRINALSSVFESFNNF